jgi:uncharacterized protein YegL
VEILPVYAVCDESGSMAGEPIAAINNALPELHQEIGSNPALCDRARFGLIAFSDDAHVLLELCDLSDLREMPGLSADGMTNYGAALRLARTTIEQDVRALKASGHKVVRPVVFFLTDGVPSDDWVAAREELVSPGNPTRPHIVAFGIGNADPDVVARVATFRAFIQAEGGVTPAKALREFVATLTRSIMLSVRLDSGPRELVVPPEIDGFDRLPLDLV